MTISSNTLFHFTNKIEDLINILTNDFRPHFCLEDRNFIPNRIDYQEVLEYAIPMVCFCDIPLSLAKNHMENYGNYGIGLSKEWGMRNNISPILYAYKNSAVTSGIFQMSLRTKKHETEKGEQSDEDLIKGVFDDIFWMTCFIKKYKGKLWRNGKYTNEIRFYDEREWRFVPELSDNLFKYGLEKSQFFDVSFRNKANSELLEREILHFEPSDIKYIIVASDYEIIPIINEIERIKDKYSQNDIKLLSSRVISAEQIYKDF